MGRSILRELIDHQLANVSLITEPNKTKAPLKVARGFPESINFFFI